MVPICVCFWINFVHCTFYIRNVISNVIGERLPDAEVDEIIRLTDLQEDLEGNVKYEGKNMSPV